MEELLKIKEVCKILGLSEPKVLSLMDKEKTLPFLNLNKDPKRRRVIRFHRSDVEEFINKK